MIDFKITKLEEDDTISLSSGKSPIKVVGIDKLVQQVVKILLTSPGNDIWNLGIGGGLRNIISTPPVDNNLQIIYSEIAMAVSDTERYLLQEQMGIQLNDDEMLQSLTMESCTYDKTNNRWVLVLRLLSVSNQSATVNLG